MALPDQPVTLDPAQVADLNRRLADARHDINNHLTLMSTAIELIRRDPSIATRLAQTMVDRPHLIREELLKFSHAFEEALRIVRS